MQVIGQPPAWETTCGRRTRRPAWAMSMILHLLLLVLLGIGYRQSRDAPRRDESDRRVAIVLARSTELRETEYFEAAEEQQRRAREQAAAVPPLPAAAPAASPHVELPVELPGRETPLPTSAVETVTLGSGRSARRPVLPPVDNSDILAEEAARRQNLPPVGAKTGLTLFGAASVGHRFVFVIDRSHSMGGAGLGALTAAEGELRRALQELTAEQEFQIIAYHQKPVYFDRDGPVPATPSNRERVGEFFAGLAAFGSTDHLTALLAGLRQDADVLFLLTDGADPLLTDEQLALVHRRAKGRTSIYCIRFGFGPDSGEHFMRRLARQNGGDYIYVNVNARR